MRAAAKAVIEALLVAYRKAGGFLVMEGTARFPLMPGFLELGRAHDDTGKRHASTQLIKPLRGKRHIALLPNLSVRVERSRDTVCWRLGKP